MKKLVLTIAIVAAAGCATAPQGSYSPPTSANYSNSIVVNSDSDKTWNALVNYASQTFFAIENFEKDSGLMTLSFGAANISKFIDCGDFQLSEPKFTGKYADFVERNGNAKMTGKMNLRVSPDGQGKTRVTVSARYILNTPPSTQQVYNMWTGGYNFVNIPSTTWAFDSKTSDTQYVPNPVNGTTAGRTCAPTGYAEKSILEGLEL